MTKENKDNIAVTSAIVMLCFGMALTAIGFFVSPVGEVHDSILWILGQALLYAGAIFGVAYYTKGVIDKQVKDLENRYLKDKEQEQDNEAEA